MGNFLVIVPSENSRHEAIRLFTSGLQVARSLKSQLPNSTIETDWALAAMFPRRNNSGSPIVTDPETGNWLLAIGTWFHTDGYGSGDESLLLNHYIAVGADQMASKLEGFFVIVVGDAMRRETILVTDLTGSCHCFVRSLKNGIALSGSSLLLAALGDIRLDPVGCQEFLYTGIVYEERTIYQEVCKLGPASIFQFAEGRSKSQKRYWQVTDTVPESLDGEYAVGLLREKLTRAALKVGRVFSEPVCDLTGGYDSRVVVAAFLTAGVNFSTTVSGPKDSPDVTISRELARLLGLRHIHVEPDPISFEKIKNALAYTDGEYDLVEYARILEIHQILSEQFDVSINGSFGEVARGYWWELLFPRIGAYRELNSFKLARRRYAAQVYDRSLFPEEEQLDLVSHFDDVIQRTNKGLSGFPNTSQMDHAYLMMRMQRWQGRIASSTNQLWPCLSLFSLRSVLETALKAKANLRKRSLLVRKMLNELQPRLATFPLDCGHPAIPLRWKNFHRFWPVVHHYRKKLQSKSIGLVERWGKPLVRPPIRSSAYLHLWDEEEVRELLNPETMKIGCLLDRIALNHFLKKSQQSDFPFSQQWARILSLEYALRALERVNG